MSTRRRGKRIQLHDDDDDDDDDDTLALVVLEQIAS